MTTRKQIDVYDRAVEHLADNPSLIEIAWIGTDECKEGCLFAFATKNRCRGDDEHGNVYGCVTMIKSDDYVAEDAKLTEAIRNDPEVAGDVREYQSDTRRKLLVLAEYQRKMDKQWRRKPPDVRFLPTVKEYRRHLMAKMKQEEEESRR
jgi:hypothetical protein